MSNQSFQVRDQRKPNHHWADNEVLDDFGARIGAYAYAVYMCICRFAGNNDGRCTRTYRQIGNLIGISPDTVARSTDKLVAVGLLAKQQADRTEQGMVFVVLAVPKKERTAHSMPFQVAANSGTPLPPIAVPPTANSGTPYRPQRQPLPPTAVGVPPIAVGVPPIAVPNKETRLSLDFTQDYKGGASRPAPSASVLIARDRFWRIFDTIPFDQHKNRDSENMMALRRAAVESGLGLTLARTMLEEHPTWKTWPYLSMLDSQQEINFPPAPEVLPVTALPDSELIAWNTRKNQATDILAGLSKKKSTDLRSKLMSALTKQYPQAHTWPNIGTMLDGLMLKQVMGENKDFQVDWKVDKNDKKAKSSV